MSKHYQKDLVFNFSIDNFLHYIDILTAKYFAKIAFAGLIILVGYIFAKLIKKLVVRHLSKTNPIAQNFVSNIVFFVVFSMATIIGLTKLGMHTSSIVAIVGSLGIAIGLAFQPSLSNLSSGLMIVLFRPFKINDFIEADSITGNVKQIGLFSTSLLKADNTLIIIPNSRVMSNKIINFSDQKIRRIDIDIVIDTQQNVQDLKKVIMDILLNDYRVLSYPSPAVIIHSFKENGLVISIRPWTSYNLYWELLYDLQEEIHKICLKNNVSFAKFASLS